MSVILFYWHDGIGCFGFPTGVEKNNKKNGGKVMRSKNIANGCSNKFKATENQEYSDDLKIATNTPICQNPPNEQFKLGEIWCFDALVAKNV